MTLWGPAFGHVAITWTVSPVEARGTSSPEAVKLGLRVSDRAGAASATNTFALVAGDVGKVITCKAIASNSGGGAGGGGQTSTPTPSIARDDVAPSAGSDGSSTITIDAPGAGALEIKETANLGKSSAVITLATTSLSVTKAGKVKVRLTLSKLARRRIGSRRTLRATITVTFRPAGAGAASVVHRTVVLHVKKKRG